MARALVGYAYPVEASVKAASPTKYTFFNLKDGGYYVRSSFPSKVERRCQDALARRESTVIEYRRAGYKVVLKFKFDGGVFFFSTSKGDNYHSKTEFFYAMRQVKPGETLNVKFFHEERMNRLREVAVPPEIQRQMVNSFLLRKPLHTEDAENGTRITMTYTKKSYACYVVYSDDIKRPFFGFEVIP